MTAPHDLAENLRHLRAARGITQARAAAAAGVPRATWAHLESGAGNPTLAVLTRVAAALSVTLEGLVSAPRADVHHYRAASLKARTRQGVVVRNLLPDALPGVQLERLELPPHSRMVGTPHRGGTREYLTCESGALALTASGRRFDLDRGDVVVFRGDQPHAYHNEGGRPAVGYSALVIDAAPVQRTSPPREPG